MGRRPTGPRWGTQRRRGERFAGAPLAGARVAGLALLVAVAAAACEATGPASLDVGDCIADAPAFVGEGAEVRPISCDEPHGGEVLLVEDYPDDGDYPGDPAFQGFVSARCIAAFEEYTGRDFMNEDEMDLGWLQPSEEDWAAGGRRIVCFATPIEAGAKTTGSIRKP